MAGAGVRRVAGGPGARCGFRVRRAFASHLPDVPERVEAKRVDHVTGGHGAHCLKRGLNSPRISLNKCARGCDPLRQGFRGVRRTRGSRFGCRWEFEDREARSALSPTCPVC
ncbi:hypothetical protein APASM_1662 [Actinosynnema pretiosum subsp. pretiosum]|nr:hypothetical protein APASM_1662 [Actinosynnema pretiosum subsp. pretiosum]